MVVVVVESGTVVVLSGVLDVVVDEPGTGVAVDDVVVDDSATVVDVSAVSSGLSTLPGNPPGLENAPAAPVTALLMYLRQIVAGNVPPYTVMPCTLRMYRVGSPGWLS